jgi:hypothetical protein
MVMLIMHTHYRQISLLTFPMRPEFTLPVLEGLTIHILSNLPRYFRYAQLFLNYPYFICKHFSFTCTMAAESDYLVSTHGSQVQLHASRRCSSSSSRITKLRN